MERPASLGPSDGYPYPRHAATPGSSRLSLDGVPGESRAATLQHTHTVECPSFVCSYVVGAIERPLVGLGPGVVLTVKHVILLALASFVGHSAWARVQSRAAPAGSILVSSHDPDEDDADLEASHLAATRAQRAECPNHAPKPPKAKRQVGRQATCTPHRRIDVSKCQR